MISCVTIIVFVRYNKGDITVIFILKLQNSKPSVNRSMCKIEQEKKCGSIIFTKKSK